MEQQMAEQIEQRVETADELMTRVNEMLEEDESPKSHDKAIETLLPFMTENPLFAQGWLRIAQIAQAGSEDKPLNVDETELALRWACFLNDTWPDAFLELGNFMLMERNEATASLDMFRAAADLALEQLEDAYVGMIDSLNSLGDTDELKKVVEQARQHLPDNEAIRQAVEDWQADE